MIFVVIPKYPRSSNSNFGKELLFLGSVALQLRFSRFRHGVLTLCKIVHLVGTSKLELDPSSPHFGRTMSQLSSFWPKRCGVPTMSQLSSFWLKNKEIQKTHPWAVPSEGLCRSEMRIINALWFEEYLVHWVQPPPKTGQRVSQKDLMRSMRRKGKVCHKSLRPRAQALEMNPH